MGFFDGGIGRAGLATGTLGLSEWYNALKGKGGNGSDSGYAPLPFENPNNPIDADKIHQAFQQGLGRDATANEIEQYGKYIKSGDLTYGDIGNVIAGMPEALRSRLASQQQQYGDILSKNNQFLLNQAADTASGSFAQAGRQFSSGQGNSVLQAGQQLAAQQSPMLAAFYGNGQMGLNDTYASVGQNSLQRAYNLQDSRTNFNRSLLEYGTQRQDFNTDLQNQRAYNRNQGIGQLIGGIAGAGIGAAAGGGWAGAQLGAGIGSRAGGLFGGY